MSKPPREIELKLEVLPEDQDVLKKAAAPAGFTASRAVTKNLHSIYFDTPDQRLRKARVSLRVRKTGKTWIQTAKIGTGVKGGLSSAVEVEHPVAGRAIDLALIDDPQVLSYLVQAIDGETLLETCETLIRRTTRVLTSENGSRLEIAFDVGEIRAGPKTQPLAEVELELQKGSAPALFAAAKGLLGETPFRFSPCSKAERGFRLAGNEEQDRSIPLLASGISLSPEETVETAYRNVLRSCLEQIAHNRAVILAGDHPEGPHQLRIGLRRLRSAFRLFKTAINTETMRPLDGTARRIASQVGVLRDLDALDEDIVAPLEGHAPEGLAIEPLHELIEAQRRTFRPQLGEYLRSAEVNDFILDLAACTEARGWLAPERFDQSEHLAAPVGTLAGPALDLQWKKAARYGRKIDDLDIPERHEMRKALKKLRYGVEFFGSLYPRKEVKPFLKQLRTLQDVFGYLNDVAVAEKLLTIPGAKGDAAQAIGFAIGWHEAQARHMWAHATQNWKEMKSTRKFWR